MTVMATRKAFLNSLLRALVQEWGYKEVVSTLTQFSNAPKGPEPKFGGSERHQRSQSATKFRAIEQLARAELPAAQVLAWRELATRFDRKQFLPRVSDAREFLVMMGESPGTMKDRSAAFRRILKALSDLPPERLERLTNSALHSGPSELGPLSDAISAAAVSLPRHRESVAPSGENELISSIAETVSDSEGSEVQSHEVERIDLHHRRGAR
jgi:hypothetical protein